jgi:putative transposase
VGHFVNTRGRWRGDLFDGRVAPAAMDETHLLAAVRHLGLDPVGARLARRAGDWPWPSVRAHMAGADDALAVVAPVLLKDRLFRAIHRRR